MRTVRPVVPTRAAVRGCVQGKSRGGGSDRRALDCRVADAPFGTARLRNQRFFSLSELNAAIRVLLDRLNDRVTRHLGPSRRVLFNQVERSALRPLPAEAYVFCEWKQCTVGLAPIN